MTDQVLLSVPLSQGPYVILCDASDRAIGAILCQWYEDKLNILEFGSKKFSSAERNWSTREREAFAIKWSIMKWEDYVKGAKIYVFTDHASLQWLESASTGKIQRWALYLQQFDVTVRAIQGRDNGVADWLSRSTPNLTESEETEFDSMCVPIYVEFDVNENQNRSNISLSPFLPKYNEWVESHKNINKEDLKYLRRSEDGLFYSIKSNKLYVPENLREAVMNYFHTSRYGGHHGINKTARKMYRWFYWPRLKFDLSRYIESCLACRRVGSPAVRYFRKVLEKAEPFQLVSMDFVGPREWLGEKLNYLVIIDHFFRFLVAVVVKDLTTETVMKSMNEFWLRYFSAPDVVLVDRGSAFISQRFKNFITGELTRYLIYSGSGYPQGNSINESAHKGLESSIIARKQYDTSTEFSVMLNDATLAYNSTPHSSTGYSPFYMLYGKEISLPGLQRFQEKLPEEIRRARIKDVRMQAMKRAIISSDSNMKIFATSNLKIGDQVVYKLTEYQQKAFIGEGEQIMKYTPEWSLPVIVHDVKMNTIDVKLDLGKIMNISRRLVRKIGTDLPKSLQGISTAIIEKEYPKIREQPEWIRDKKIVKRPRILCVR